VKAKRAGSDEKWELTDLREATYYQWEYKKLRSKGVQVFTFYVDTKAKIAFEEIAKETNGKC
jgi:hypothetical protein